MNGSVVASSSGMFSNDSDGSNDSVNRSIATGIATGYMGVCVRLGISDGSNESVNRSIAIWYSDRVGLCPSCWLAVS